MLDLMLGSVRHQLDDKDRFRIPAKFRQTLGDKAYILPGREVGKETKKYCLYVIPENRFEEIYERIGDSSLYGGGEEADLLTTYFAMIQDVEEDGQGRLRLRSDLAEMLNVVKDVVFVGKGHYLEMWSGEVWDERFTYLNSENVNRALQNLKNRGV